MSGTQPMAWHYTIGDRADGILRDGIIRPATGKVPKREIPAVWFSRNPVWEETANKTGVIAGRQFPLSREETIRLGNGGWRFGMPTDDLIKYWKGGVKRLNMKSGEAKRLNDSAQMVGADHRDWWVRLGSVPVELTTIQRLVNGEWMLF